MISLALQLLDHLGNLPLACLPSTTLVKGWVCVSDAPSLDNPADLYYPNHLARGKRLVVHTELLANITKIPRREGFYVIGLPLRLEGATGSPIRMITVWEE